jgi:hypothetical protein
MAMHSVLVILLINVKENVASAESGVVGSTLLQWPLHEILLAEVFTQSKPV